MLFLLSPQKSGQNYLECGADLFRFRISVWALYRNTETIHSRCECLRTDTNHTIVRRYLRNRRASDIDTLYIVGYSPDCRKLLLSLDYSPLCCHVAEFACSEQTTKYSVWCNPPAEPRFVFVRDS